jgi:hypothetical protein
MTLSIALCTACMLYEVTSQTGMPNLEENLRYTVTHQERCATERELLTGFPVLSHPSLAGCRLGEEQREGDTVTMHLSCDSGHGTSGTATWRIGSSVLQGILTVKLGGKNMTFFQRLTAKRLGRDSCPGPAVSPVSPEGEHEDLPEHPDDERHDEPERDLPEHPRTIRRTIGYAARDAVNNVPADQASHDP